MHKRLLFFLAVLVLPLTLLVACSSMESGWVVPAQHPPEAELGHNRPMCTDCHDARGEHLVFADFNHTPFFTQSHRNLAARSAQVCAMCHQQSFCNTCHATAVELKPSLRDQADTYRNMPHRGDYLSRHKIDGRLDPASCYRCHGNPKAARTCAPCHG